MNRRIFLKNTSTSLVGLGAGASAGSKLLGAQGNGSSAHVQSQPGTWVKPKDYRKEPFQRLVILGEHGGRRPMALCEGGPLRRRAGAPHQRGAG
jgi:hypothetical protein